MVPKSSWPIKPLSQNYCHCQFSPEKKHKKGFKVESPSTRRNLLMSMIDKDAKKKGISRLLKTEKENCVTKRYIIPKYQRPGIAKIWRVDSFEHFGNRNLCNVQSMIWRKQLKESQKKLCQDKLKHTEKFLNRQGLQQEIGAYHLVRDERVSQLESTICKAFFCFSWKEGQKQKRHASVEWIRLIAANFSRRTLMPLLLCKGSERLVAKILSFSVKWHFK